MRLSANIVRGVDVVGVLRHHRAHRFAVVAMEAEPIGRRLRRRIALRKRRDVVALALAGVGGALLGVLDGVVRRLRARGVDGRVVVVRPDRQRDAPVRHRRLRVELGRAAEVARGLVVIEAVEQANALVEIDLRVGVRRRDREVIVAEAGMQLRRCGRQRRRMCVLLRGGGKRRCERGEAHQCRGSGGCGFHGADLAPKRGRCQVRPKRER